MSDQLPAPPTDSILDRIKQGRLVQDPNSKVDSRIYDPDTGNPILIGNTDPNIIGPDDTYDFAFRDDKAYPELPSQVKSAEIRFILPMAKIIANAIGITVLDEVAYDRVLQALRDRSLFVLLNLHKTKISDGVASWFGLILMCKKHPLVLIRLKMKLSTEQIGIDQIRLWEKSNARYLVHRESSGGFFTREQTIAKVLDYLKYEGVLPNL